MESIDKPLGILGGTFDPVHQGHLKIATTALQQCQLKEIRFIPCKQPLLKNAAHANTLQRLAMLQLACQPYANFIIDEREITRSTPSYMVETLLSLRADYPTNPLCLIIGSDAFLDLSHWYHWQQLIDLAHIIIANRPDYFLLHDNSELAIFYQQHLTNQAADLHQHLNGKIMLLNMPLFPFASRQIRQQIAKGEDVEQAVPRDVLSYIKKHQIYDSR